MGSDRLDAWCAAFAPALVNPPPPGPGVCRTCRGPAPAGRRECSSCRRIPERLDVVLPISWSVAGGPLHRALRGYKDDPHRRDAHGVGRRPAAPCSSASCAVTRHAPPRRWGCSGSPWSRRCRRAPTATAVRCARSSAAVRAPPGGTPARSSPPASALNRTGSTPSGSARSVGWTGRRCCSSTTPGRRAPSAQSAAHALKRAGARRVALVVIGRHVNPAFGDQRGRCGPTPPFCWATCAVHGRRAA